MLHKKNQSILKVTKKYAKNIPKYTKLYKNIPTITKNGIVYTKYIKRWYIQNITKYTKIYQNTPRKSKYTKHTPKNGLHWLLLLPCIWAQMKKDLEFAK